MDPLVTLFVAARRSARRALPAGGVVLLAMVVLLHAAHPLETWTMGALGLMLTTLLATRAHKRAASVEQSLALDLEVGLLAMIAAYAVVVHVDRSLGGATYPVVYVGIALISALCHRLASLGVLGLAMLFEVLLSVIAFDGLTWGVIGPHAVFLTAVAMVNMLSLRLEMLRLRRASRKQLEAERDRVREEAYSYRLVRAPSHGDARTHARDEERLLRSGVDQIQLSLLFALRLLRESLDLHTALLLWLNDDSSQLRISELVTRAGEDDVCEGPFSSRDGILGAVFTQGTPVCISHLKPSYVLPYYADACPVQVVCAAPVFQHGAMRGVLVVDRTRPDPFTPLEEELVEQAARFAARAIENERVFVQLERTKVEQGKLYRASERLGAAATEQDVVDVGVSCASEIASVDFAAVTAYDVASDSHLIRAAIGDGAEVLEGQRFGANNGLVSMALINRHPLPYRGEYDPSHQRVFDKGHKLPEDMPSLLVLPLVVHDVPLGTLVLGSCQPNAFHDAARSLLEVLASHLAVSLSNARMVRQLEEQATTDGLTGLLNKRSMLDVAEEKLAAARRFGRRLSVLIADIDHFKRVNDTYGHDVGDVVIKELAAIHERAKRSTDAVARFGGEEFVTICEETDTEGALLLAERVREELKQTVFHASGEELSCTCSIGIATFPSAGPSWRELFKAADEALYASKRNGRDRTTVFGAPRSSRRGSAA